LIEHPNLIRAPIIEKRSKSKWPGPFVNTTRRELVNIFVNVGPAIYPNRGPVAAILTQPYRTQNDEHDGHTDEDRYPYVQHHNCPAGVELIITIPVDIHKLLPGYRLNVTATGGRQVCFIYVVIE